jgi:large subunit ribosomal protein L16
MLLPKKVLHRKWHKPRRNNKGIATRTNTVAFGAYGLVAQSYAWITSRQLESARRVMAKYVHKGGKIWIRVFPDRPITRKGSEVPMGGGKGSPDHYVCTIKPGTVMLEMSGIADNLIKEALSLAAYKLPVKTKIAKKV